MAQIAPTPCSLEEKFDLNQYWYSQGTTAALIQELEAAAAPRVAFLSTPSVYCSLEAGSLVRQDSVMFDLDVDRFKGEGPCVLYDFNEPQAVPDALHHSFDCCVIDPPFITEQVWRNYAATAKLLLREEGKIILSTVSENAALLQQLLAVQLLPFKPCIPTLIYQFSFFSNFDCKHLCHENPEIGA